MRGFGKEKPYEYGIKCPNCKAMKLRKSGRAVGGGFKVKQRYACYHCGIVTVNPIKA